MRSITSPAARRRTFAVAALATLATATAAGTADAAPRLNGAQLKRGSVPADRIKPNSLTGRQINESRLGLVPMASIAKYAEAAGTAKVADVARTADHARTADNARAAETARTAGTAQDAQKLNGRDQTAFLANTVRTVSRQSAPTVGSAAGAPAEVQVSCNPDEKAIGGGGAWIITGFQDGNEPSALHLPITASMPLPAVPDVNGMTGWRVLGRNLAVGETRSLRVYAICVPRTA